MASGLPIARAVVERLAGRSLIRRWPTMVPVVDNLTTICGCILSRSEHPTLGGYDLINALVERANPVPGRADLLSPQVGKEIAVAVRRELLGDAEPGDHMRCRAKRIPDGAMCEPHPEPTDFALCR
jgi:hypothetical protein